MKKLVLILPFLFLFFLQQVEAQNRSRLYVGIECGFHDMRGNINDRWEFRGSENSFNSQESYFGDEYVKGEGDG